MRTTAHDGLPLPVRRGLKKLGGDIAIARRKRRITAASMADRAFISQDTYRRVERGNPSVGIGIYASVLFVLGIDGAFADAADAVRDVVGLALDQEHLPKRVRSKRTGMPK